MQWLRNPSINISCIIMFKFCTCFCPPLGPLLSENDDKVLWSEHHQCPCPCRCRCLARDHIYNPTELFSAFPGRHLVPFWIFYNEHNQLIISSSWLAFASLYSEPVLSRTMATILFIPSSPPKNWRNSHSSIFIWVQSEHYCSWIILSALTAIKSSRGSHDSFFTWIRPFCFPPPLQLAEAGTLMGERRKRSECHCRRFQKLTLNCTRTTVEDWAS